MSRPAKRGPPSTIVIKLGEPLSICAVHGHKVVLVSSGAIGVGLRTMDIPQRPKSLSKKQALAAIGQGRLIALWDNLFGQFDQRTAQVLLTRGDISDRTRYLNAVNTLNELLSMGVVPIVNENDTISVSVTSMIHADYLFLLTDVDGLYTSNPRKDPSAKKLDVVISVAAIRAQVSTSTLGSSLGTGGMETKLIAAEIATGAGVTTVIASSKQPSVIVDTIDYYTALRSTSVPTSGAASPVTPQKLNKVDLDEVAASLTWPRPPHTVFKPALIPMRDLKAWTSHTLYPAGSVIIDSGAHAVLSRRESGGRLLPAGVLGVRGSFASGQAVRILVHRPTEGVPVEAREVAQVPYSNVAATTPCTPVLEPGASVTASVISLVPLSRSESSSSLADDMTSDSQTITDDEIPLIEKMDECEVWDCVEVGRGLANYNSAQISRVRGLNSSRIVQLLGYADTEYVVENITIRVSA
ncbi:Aspartate/glutamate/uridylate kinase [Suillus lakei]|nr:Aspartate/glutamate/uridylate kinase [Suillus lakei]